METLTRHHVLSLFVFPLPLGNHFCFFDGNQKSICFSSSVTSVSRRFHVCFVQWMKLRNKFIWNLPGSGVCGVFFKSGPLPRTWWRLYAIFLMHKLRLCRFLFFMLLLETEQLISTAAKHCLHEVFFLIGKRAIMCGKSKNCCFCLVCS